MFNHTRLHWIVGSALVLLCSGTGCASLHLPARAQEQAKEEPAAPPSDPRRLHLELIEKMLENGRSHAALAHLDALSPDEAAAPVARLLRAEALRRNGQLDEAWRIYEPLLVTEAAAAAWRGLALIEAERGDLETGIAWLRKARDLQPTAARFRNDLGYALLLRGELESARIELLTALELEESHRAARNLVLVLLLQDQDVAAERLARQHQIDEAGLERLRLRAERLRARIAMRGGA
jgi:Flp pilus assembly protein TadD